MKRLTIMGAGGKMGCRTANNFRGHADYEVQCVEVSEAGRARLREQGFEPVEPEEALPRSEVVILAVPDRAIGSVARAVVPHLASGAMVITLDPAAAHAGELPSREDIAYFVTHPCHPPLFNDETDPEVRRDYFGGVKAKQSIVCALMQGSEADYAAGEAIARDIYRPVTRAHRVTVEQMAILEPTMAETVNIACLTVIREAMDEAIARGVPKEAAWDFMIGHLNIELAIVFDQVGSPFSDGALLIKEYGRRALFKPDWKKLFEPESVKEQVKAIVAGEL